jgi:2,4-dienoyl-CoA reductase-like NADH-dependent reductase (Old Yellow Enzyme family)
MLRESTGELVVSRGNSGAQRSSAALFEPFSLGPLRLPNRLVMAPMTRYFSPRGIPGADVAAYYRRRAEAGCGLIITEGTTIESPVAGGYMHVPHFWGPALDGWRHVVEEVHAAGGKIIPQLWHVGMQRDPALCPNPELPGLGPSGLNRKLERIAAPMTCDEIAATIDQFARAAAAAKALGFDGIEIHGAHGYLLDQYFWHGTNKRDDEYGGSIEARARFGAEVVAAVRAAVGPDFPLLLRISQWKGHDYNAKIAETPDELARFLAPLVAAGVDIFDCSQRRFWEAEFEGSALNLAGWVKRLTGVPTITVGSVSLGGDFIGSMIHSESAAATGIDELLDRIEDQEFDLVALGRALIADAEWPIKIREHRYDEIHSFDPEMLKTLD